MIHAADRTISSPSRPRVVEGTAAHLPGLDLLRAIAILLVFAYHASVFFAHPAELRSWAAFGWTGVDLFFVLSGFLITSQLLAVQARGPINLTGYFLKRGFRILPAYWLVLAVYFLMPAWREIESPAPLWKYLTFTQNLGLDTVNNRTFSHAWSLCIEEQFYLALPLALIALKGKLNLRRLIWGVACLMLAGLAVRWLSWQFLVQPTLAAGIAGSPRWSREWATWIYYPTQCRLDGLLTGVLVAGVFRWRPDVRSWTDRRPLMFLALGILLLGAGWVLGSPMVGYSCALLGYPVISGAFGAFLICVISPSFRLPKTIYVPIKWIAVLSYAVYLTHKVAGHVLQPWLTRLGFSPEGWPMLIALLTGCLLVGLVVHLLIERPSFWIRDQLLRRQGAPRVQRAGVC